MNAWSDLEHDIVVCRACPRLVAWREQVAREKRAAFQDQEYWGRPVPGFGDHQARVLLVGLAPAAHGANRTGRMFTGDRSGDFLFRALWRVGLANRPESTHRGDGLRLTGAYVTAPVRCPPPGNRPTTGERDRCRPFLNREMALLDQVRVVVPLGQFGYTIVCGELGIQPRPKFGHGVEAVAPNGMTVVASYHVSQQNTFTGTLTEPMFDRVLRRACELAGLEPTPTPGARW